VQRAIAGMNASTDPEPGTESFYAAVLFADISGFTAMTERLAMKSNGAELLSQKLNDLFSSFLV
jgi:class 3 adenylate cyclase